MHLPNIIARWAAHEGLLDRRQLTTALPITKVTSVIDSLTSKVEQTTTAPAQTTKAATTQITTKEETTQQQDSTTDQPQSTTQPTNTQKTTSAPTNTQKTLSTSRATTQSKAAVTSHPTNSIVETPTDVPTDASSSIPLVTSTGKSNSNNSGSFSGIKGSQVGMAVGIVVGIAGGFAIIIGAIYFWRRHQRRKNMERLGSMEELTRAPSPPLLSRSLTQGRNGPRQPIDDDDDDFLTPMDTLPNTHRLDDYNGQDDHYQGNDREMSMYSNDGDYFHTSETGAPQLPPSYPVAPPAAVVPANARFYTGEMDSSGLSTSPTNGGAIPAWSSMNKYTAYTPGANTAAAASQTQAYGAPGAAASNRTSSYGRVSSFSRPGAGYRGFDNTSPSPSTTQPQQPASGSGLGDFKF